MTLSFSQFLVEEEKSVYFTFGRMNPPTIGHGKLLDVLAAKSGRNPYRVYLSQSVDKDKNPLSYSDKIKSARKMFPKHARAIMINKKVRTAIEAATALYDEGFRNLVLVVGADRVREFEVLLNKYNGKEARHGFYNFKRIDVISAGDRDPDAEGVEGMSASKMRSFAKENDFISFGQGLPKSISNRDARQLFNNVRKGMGLSEAKEFRNHVQLTPVSSIREAYVNESLFELGETVTINKNGIVGNIKHLGTNYIIVESKGETWRCWLNDVTKMEPNMKPAWDINFVNATPERGVVRESNQPEWGTPESTRKAKKMTPGETIKEGDSWRSEGHYTADGKEWKGDQHYHNGMIMTGKTHSKDSQQLYHYKELPKDIRKKIEASLGEAKDTHVTKDGKVSNKGLWFYINQRRKKGLPPKKPGQKGYPKTLNIEDKQ